MTHTTERVRETPGFVHPSSEPSSQPPRRPLEASIIWGLIAVGIVSAVVLLLLSITSDTAGRPTAPDQPPVRTSVPGVPMSADAAERYLAHLGATRPAGVPGSADAAERYLADKEGK